MRIDINGVKRHELLVRTISVSVLLLLSVLTGCRGGDNPAVTDVSPGVEHPDTAGFRVIERVPYDPPEEAYPFDLIDQNGERLTLEDLRGSVLMVTFIYTHCPEACPLVAANFRNVQYELEEEVAGKDLVQVLITTDPDRDSPERLLRYTRALNADWYFLTEELDVLREVWDGFDVYWEIKDRSREVVVFHSYKTYLIDREGNMRYLFVGVWYPEDIIPDIKNLIEE